MAENNQIEEIKRCWKEYELFTHFPRIPRAQEMALAQLLKACKELAASDIPPCQRKRAERIQQLVLELESELQSL